MERDLEQAKNPFSGRWLRHIFNSLSGALIVAEANEKVVFHWSFRHDHGESHEEWRKKHDIHR